MEKDSETVGAFLYTFMSIFFSGYVVISHILNK